MNDCFQQPVLLGGFGSRYTAGSCQSWWYFSVHLVVWISQDTKIGQWSTAAFQSSERGMKFLRLMGSFKKGSAPREDPSVTTNKSNMALNREGEEKLHQALKMEFDKAMDLKQHRRIGLGFQPAANKKVYIDKYASRSIKFVV